MGDPAADVFASTPESVQATFVLGDDGTVAP